MRISTSSLPWVRSMRMRPLRTCCGPSRTTSPRRETVSSANSITSRVAASRTASKRGTVRFDRRSRCDAPLVFGSLIDAMPSVGSSLRMVGTACLSSPRIAFSHDRLAVGLVISASIFTRCSRLSSRTRLAAVLGTEFLDDATAGASRIVRPIGPVGGVVVRDDQRIDRAGSVRRAPISGRS
jgi:hypothetical protein